MLTPSYLLNATEPAEEIAEKLHGDILTRIIERIKIRFERGDDYILTAVDKWQIETLQQAGFLLDDIQREIASATGYMQTEIAEAMEAAGVKALEYDDAIYREAGLDPVPLVQSPYLIQLMQDTYEQTAGEWSNFTSISKRAVHDLFVEACDTAYIQAISGAISPAQAYLEALEKIVDGGVYVQYPGGRRDTIETATARAVRTGISQASGRIQLARMDEMGVDLILVSSHLGARPEHYVWQGKVYSRTGGGKYPDFVETTGYGSVTGLCGANCRHNFSPYFEGMKNPFKEFDSEENKKQYELEQRQRTLERRIRETKRQTMGWKTALDGENDPVKKAALEKKYQQKAALLQMQNKAYNDFCKETGQKKRSDRIAIAKWDRKQAAQARAAAKQWREYQSSRKYREKSDLNGFYTMDNRPKGMDIIKPKNVINEMKKSGIGTELYNFMRENEIDVNLWYGVDVPKGRTGIFEDGIIHVYVENTKTVLDTALTVIHEATHAKINKPNSKNQELECFKNEKLHQGIELTDSVIQSIIKEINELYYYLDWE